MTDKGDSDIELEIEGDDLKEGKKTLLQNLKESKPGNTEKQNNQDAGLYPEDEIDKMFEGWDEQSPYTCTLLLEDLGTSDDKSEVKIYQIKVLRDKEREKDIEKNNRFGLFCKWANTGGKYDYSINMTESLEEAINNFKEKFYEKTFNHWDQREIFSAKPGAYKWLGSLRDGEKKEMKETTMNPERAKLRDRIRLISLRAKTQPSSLGKELYEALQKLFDLESSERALDTFGINRMKMSITDIELRDILRAHKILAEIEYQVFSKSRKNQRIFEMSVDFGTIIPQNLKSSQNQMIDDISKLRRAYHMLQLMTGIYYQTHILKSISYSEGSQSQPLDDVYLTMGCQLRPIATNTVTYEDILKLMNCHAPAHHNMRLSVKDVFEIQKEGLFQSYFPFRKLKRRLLWIGGHSAKIVEYLHRGFNFIRTESASCGGLFGKAIYATDVVSKAAKHCGVDTDGQQGFLLLCDVAVGREFVTDRSKIYNQLPKGYHSIKGQGKCESTDTIEIDGATCSVGAPQESEAFKDSSFMYNEFAIFDEAQLKPLYLVKVEFGY